MKTVIAYRGIGSECGKFIDALDALPYAMRRCGITWAQHAGIDPDCQREFEDALVNWFYSGDWEPVRTEDMP